MTVVSQSSGRVVGRTAGKGIRTSTAASFGRLSDAAGDFGCGNNRGGSQCQLHMKEHSAASTTAGPLPQVAKESPLPGASAKLLMSH